jgi:hypothetical protein
MNDSLYHAVVRALSFFDIFDHPLTDRELFEYVYGANVHPRLDFFSFVTTIRTFPSTHCVCTHGLWHLVGRESILATHTYRSASTFRKLRRLSLLARLIRHVPFVRGVYVCNTFAFNAANAASDIDVLIVVRSGRIWTARILTSALLSLFFIRRTHRRVKNRICLSFYLADRALNISKFKLPDDIYLSYWLRTLVPLYDPDLLGASILEANRALVSPFFAHAKYFSPSFAVAPYGQGTRSVIARFLEQVFDGEVGRGFENAVRAFQRRKIMHNPESLVHAKDTRVVVNDRVLKFHENDRRALYRDMWLRRLKNMGIRVSD